MTTTNNYTFAFGAAQGGVPLTPTMTTSLDTAMQGGSGTQTFIQDQIVMNNFYAYVVEQGSEAWSWSTDGNGNPAVFAAQVSESNSISLVLQVTLDENVINGAEPSSFTANGESYWNVGTLTATQYSTQEPVWHIEMAIGAATAVPRYLLRTYGPELVTTCLNALKNGISSAFNGGAAADDEADVADAAEQAADDAAVDGAEVGDATVSITADVGAFTLFAGLAALPEIILAFLHGSYQGLQIYNLTPYDIGWSVAYQDQGTLVSAPLNGAGSTSFNQLLPALSAAMVSGPPTPLVSSATLGFASTNEITGLGYVLTATLYNAGTTEQVDQLYAMFDIPLDGSNSLALTTSAPSSAKQWYGDNAGVLQQTALTVQDATVSATATYDFLQGTHPSPGGQVMYWYNSVLVFQPAG